MNNVARLSIQDRRDLFTEAADRLAIGVGVIEKDFWVCFVLREIFGASKFKDALVFKGGTSLSKVFGLIERFSEDIDLVLDWTLLGFAPQDPLQDRASKTQQDKFNKQVNELAAQFISQEFCPALDAHLGSANIGLSATVDPHDSQVVNIQYPATLPAQYIRPEIRLEIGPLASWIPSAPYVVKPYAAEALPNLFGNPECPVVSITAERTFWEKATILHQEAHRPSNMPDRYSRHYYDLYRLAISSVKDVALADPKLLRAVVEFKQRFYPSSWARYDLAAPGSFRILPSSENHTQDLKHDYEQMQVMLFGNRPTFDEILRVLTALEAEINALEC